MPQPKSSRSSSGARRKPAAKRAATTKAAAKPAARKPTAKRAVTAKAAAKPAARKPAAKRAAAAAKPAARRSAATAKAAAKPAARKPAAKRAAPRRKPVAARAQAAVALRDDAFRANLATLRDLLARGVVISGERIQEAMDDAVRRGRMLPQDAEELVQSLLSAGRQQTQDVLADIEQLLGRTRKEAGTAGKRARSRAAGSSDRVLQRVDKARRAAGIGAFPVLNYDDLTAAQIVERVSDLTPAELRKVRDHEKRNANRKSVLDAVARGLG